MNTTNFRNMKLRRRLLYIFFKCNESYTHVLVSHMFIMKLHTYLHKPVQNLQVSAIIDYEHSGQNRSKQLFSFRKQFF